MLLPDQPGVTLMQRLKEVGNYGFEPFFFIGKAVDSASLKILLEYEVDYILTPPVDKKRLHEKLAYIIKRENNIPKDLQLYRDARLALTGGILEMAKELANQLPCKEILGEKPYLLLGDIAMAEKDFDGAEAQYKMALTKNKESLTAFHKLADVHRSRGDLESAKNILDSLVEKNPLHLNVLKNAGLTNFDLGHLELAEKQMANLKKMDKTNKTAGSVLTGVAIKQGRFDGAAQNLLASHSEKEIVSTLNNAGILMSKEKNYQGAIAIYQDCLSVVKKKEFKGKIHYNIAIAHKRLEDPSKALFHAKQAVKYLSDFEKAHALIKELSNKTA